MAEQLRFSWQLEEKQHQTLSVRKKRNVSILACLSSPGELTSKRDADTFLKLIKALGTVFIFLFMCLFVHVARTGWFWPGACLQGADPGGGGGPGRAIRQSGDVQPQRQRAGDGGD